jgi:hypothetical protein
MKKALPALLAAVLLAAAPAPAVDFGLDLHLGSRAPAPIIVQEPPLFLVPPGLGFYVAVGVPYDMFYIGGRYYLCKGDAWYVAPGYGGPWAMVVHDHLPPGLRKQKFKEIVALRDAEYRSYRQKPDHYRGKAFKPGKAQQGEDGRKDSKPDMGKHKGGKN